MFVDVRSMPPLAPSIADRWLAAWALSGLVLLAIGVRLVPILLYPSMNYPDEIFQATEQAHRVVYGTGLVPWEFQFGARSWLLAGTIAALMEVARLLGDGPDYYLPVIAVAFATLAAAPVACCFLWCRRFHGLPGAIVGAAVVAVMPDLVYLGARTFSEVVGAHILVVAAYLLQPGDPVTSRRRLFAGGALLGLTFVLRVQLAPALALVALWTAIPAPRRYLPMIAAGALAVVALAGILDTATLGYPLASIWRYLVYNLGYGVSSLFGVEPWSFYGEIEFQLWGAALPAALLLARAGARRMPLLLAAAAVILAAHSAIAHKEYRFAYPAILLLAILAGLGLAHLADWGAARLRRAGGWEATAYPATAALAIAYWCSLSFLVWTGQNFTYLRNLVHDNLAAASFVAHGPVPCGIGLWGPSWSEAGGYTHFHQPAPMYWPDTPEELAATVAGFDTLVYTRPPPERFGFVTRQCFGKTCVARRPGSCASVPALPMPRPPSLVGITAPG